MCKNKTRRKKIIKTNTEESHQQVTQRWLLLGVCKSETSVWQSPQHTCHISQSQYFPVSKQSQQQQKKPNQKSISLSTVAMKTRPAVTACPVCNNMWGDMGVFPTFLFFSLHNNGRILKSMMERVLQYASLCKSYKEQKISIKQTTYISSCPCIMFKFRFLWWGGRLKQWRCCSGTLALSFGWLTLPQVLLQAAVVFRKRVATPSLLLKILVLKMGGEHTAANPVWWRVTSLKDNNLFLCPQSLFLSLIL